MRTSFGQFGDRVINLVYTWDKCGHGRDLSGQLRPDRLPRLCLPRDAGKLDRRGRQRRRRDHRRAARRRARDEIVGQDAIRAYVEPRATTSRGSSRPTARWSDRPAYRAGAGGPAMRTSTGAPSPTTSAPTGSPDTHDTGEGDGIPTAGEPNFDRTDCTNRIRSASPASSSTGSSPARATRARTSTTSSSSRHRRTGPKRLYEQVHRPRLGGALRCAAGEQLQHRVSVRVRAVPAAGGQDGALQSGAGLRRPTWTSCARTVQTVQLIYNANYQFAEPPPMPIAIAFDFAPNNLDTASWHSITGFLDRPPSPPASRHCVDSAERHGSMDPQRLRPAVGITTPTACPT